MSYYTIEGMKWLAYRNPPADLIGVRDGVGNIISCI